MAATYKAEAVDGMLKADLSGRLRRLHDELVGLGLKTKLPRNTDTLLFEAVTFNGKRVGLAAIRRGNTEVLSFPRPYWVRYAQQLDDALSVVDQRHFVETEGFVSSSQYSLRQIRISTDTIEKLSSIVSVLVRAHAAELAVVA